jgi:RecB family exonuclease
MSKKEELKLSVSKTKTFIDCKAKFNYSYNLKLPKKEWDFHILGKFCHKVLEDFHITYINGSDAPYNVTMSEAFKNAVAEYKNSMTPEMKKECWGLIDQYLRIVSNDKKNNLSANVLACEKNFQLLIDGNILLNGMIDRIQLDSDNVIHVADYKTTKNKKYLKEDWFQLLTYAYYVITVERPDIDVVRGSYILLRHDFEYITKEFTRDEILSVADKYIEYAKQIRSEKIFEPNPTFLCNYCDFLEHCQEGKQKVSPQNVFGEVKW